MKKQKRKSTKNFAVKLTDALAKISKSEKMSLEIGIKNAIVFLSATVIKHDGIDGLKDLIQCALDDIKLEELN